MQHNSSSDSSTKDFTRDPAFRRKRAELDVLIKGLHDSARKLHGHTARGSVSQRHELIDAARRGEFIDPVFEEKPQRVDELLWRGLETARDLAVDHPASEIYLRRLEDIELDFLLLEALGQPKRLRPLAVRRFGTGRSIVDKERSSTTLAEFARRMLSAVERNADPAVVPARSEDGYSVERLVQGAAHHVGLDIAIRVESGLMANAAVGDRTVFLADRIFGRIEARRVAVHEVFGHLVSAYNGRTQPLGIFAIGTGRSFRRSRGCRHLYGGACRVTRRQPLADFGSTGSCDGFDAPRCSFFVGGSTFDDRAWLCSGSGSRALSTRIPWRWCGPRCCVFDEDGCECGERSLQDAPRWPSSKLGKSASMTLRQFDDSRFKGLCAKAFTSRVLSEVWGSRVPERALIHRRRVS